MSTFFFLNINSYSRSIVSNIDGQNISLLNTNNTLIAETDLSLKAISANNYNNIVMVDSSLFCEGSAFSFETNITIDKEISVLKVSRMLQSIIISKDITAVARFVSYSRNFLLITNSYKYFIFFKSYVQNELKKIRNENFLSRLAKAEYEISKWFMNGYGILEIGNKLNSKIIKYIPKKIVL